MNKLLGLLLVISLFFNVFLYKDSEENLTRYSEAQKRLIWSLSESKLRLDMFVYYRKLFTSLFLERMYDNNEIDMNELKILKKLNSNEIEEYKNRMGYSLFNKSLYLPVKALIFNNGGISAFTKTYILNSTNFEDITDEELNKTTLGFYLGEKSCHYEHEVGRFIFGRFSFHNTNVEDRKCDGR